jgi:hypothetical protein
MREIGILMKIKHIALEFDQLAYNRGLVPGHCVVLEDEPMLDPSLCPLSFLAQPA